MDLIDQLRVLATKATTIRDLVQTEEATKNALIMPFIQALGYNVFDPLEVTPEFIADIGTKRGEKVDYVILREGKPIILVECKRVGDDLSINHADQLFRYFHVTESRFSMLTNGLVYKFFSDLEQPNKMDTKPFFEFNILEFKERDVDELKKFTKTVFDLDAILNTAHELKYTRIIQENLAVLMANPSESFVRLVSSDLMNGRRFTPVLLEQFTMITRRAFDQLLSERINARLKGAMSPESATVVSVPAQSAAVESVDLPTGPLTETTPEELEAFHIVRAILRGLVSSKQIYMRDAQSYCAVLFEDNNRKQICRFRFNNPERLVIGIFDANKDEIRTPIESVDDIFNFSAQLIAAVKQYLPAE